MTEFIYAAYGEGEFPEDEKAKQCDCEGWQKSMNLIEAAQLLAHIHGHKYDGDKFTFCPWCGKKIEE